MSLDLNFHPEVAWRASAIPKKDGTSRYLLIPGDELKQAQRNILDFLYTVKEFRPMPCVQGFVPYRNTVSAAMMHDRNSPVFIHLDVHNFFPTFPVIHVEQALLAHLDRPTVDYIMKYAVFHGKRRSQLPQGAPTSPYLTNIGMRKTDEKIQQVANSMGFIRVPLRSNP